MASKTFKSTAFKRAIDVGKITVASTDDLVKIWRGAEGDEKAISLADLAVGVVDSLSNGLISGGVVQWTGIGYVFNVSRAKANFLGVFLDSLSDEQVTLTTPDATLARRDTFILQVTLDGAGVPISMTPSFITGTPSASPVKPQINPATQIELTDILVPAASSTPTLTEQVIYDENIEWVGSSTGTGTVVFNSAVDPYQGTLSIEATNIQNNLRIRLTRASDFDITTVQTLGKQLKLKATLGTNQNIGVKFLDSTGASISNEVILNITKNTTVYQFLGEALTLFTFTSTLARSIEFRYIRTSGSTTHSGFYLDIIKLEGGINPPLGVSSFLALSDTPTTYSGQAGKTVAVKADESGLEFVTGGGGGITGSGTTNEIAYFTGPTAIASLPVATYPSLTELSYMKGVATPLQPQINGKQATIAGTLTDTYVATIVAGVPTWAAPSGGSGSFVEYVSQVLTSAEKSQVFDNIGATAGSPESFSNAGVITVNDLVITKSNIYFTGASTVNLTGIVALWEGQEVTIYNETGNNLTLTPESVLSSANNRNYNGLILPTRTATKIKYVQLGGGFRWVNISSPLLFNGGAVSGSSTFSPVGFNRASEALISAVFKSATDTSGSASIRARNASDTILFEINGSAIRSLTGHGFGSAINPLNSVSIQVKPISFNLNIRCLSTAGATVTDFLGNGSIQSIAGAFFGGANTGVVPTARVDIRGVGTTTGNTLLLEDSAGTDNAIFVDNGQIRFLRLPVAAAGLAAGSLWNNGGVLNIV